MADNYYILIRGKKYDRRMIELAEGLTSGRGDGRISVNDAKSLLRVVKDSNSYSATEKLTMEYIRKHYKFTKEGDVYFRAEIRKWAASNKKAKPASKPKKAGVAATEKPVPLQPAVAAVPAASTPEIQPNRSAFKEILLALILLIGIAALFYFIVYKSSCMAKPAQTTKPIAAPVAKAPAVVAPTATTSASAELTQLAEKSKLIFIAEKTEPTAQSLAKIKPLIELLVKEKAKIQITGHTCSLGPKELNQKISEQRAEAAKAALVAQGVSAENIKTSGVADTQPVGDNKTVAGRVANRRVSFQVIH